MLSLIAVTMLLLIVDVGNAASDKIKAQHIADHAAGAAGVIAARDLNFKAVTNRAMLANEVVIGQVIGLVSWYEMARTTSNNIALVSGWIPYVNAVTINLSRALTQLRVPVTQGAEAVVRFQQLVLQTLQTSQWAFHQASWSTTLSTLIKVVEENDSDFELALLNHQTLLNLNYLWFQFQRRSVPAGSETYTQLASSSRDPFSVERTYRWFNLLVARAEKAGGSEISTNSNRVVWQSIDSLGLHVRTLFGRQETPVGYGGSFLHQRIPLMSSSGFGRSFRINRRSSSMASRYAFRLHAGHRVPEQYRLHKNENPPAITIAVRKRKDEATYLGAVSRYQLHFTRPVRFWPGNRGESANLFNALWESAPVHIPAWERELLLWQV